MGVVRTQQSVRYLAGVLNFKLMYLQILKCMFGLGDPSAQRLSGFRTTRWIDMCSSQHLVRQCSLNIRVKEELCEEVALPKIQHNGSNRCLNLERSMLISIMELSSRLT